MEMFVGQSTPTRYLLLFFRAALSMEVGSEGGYEVYTAAAEECSVSGEAVDLPYLDASEAQPIPQTAEDV